MELGSATVVLRLFKQHKQWYPKIQHQSIMCTVAIVDAHHTQQEITQV